MMFRRTPILTALLALSPVACTQPTERLDPREFASPSAAFRPAPFWSWNDKLVDEELRRQVRDFRTAGYGGFFMHPRVGLETEYLSDEWFDKVGVCIDEAHRCGLQAWLYDEDKWPSGFAGGWMTRKFPETRGVGLLCEEIAAGAIPKALADGSTVAVCAVRRDGGGEPPVRRLAAGQALHADETAYRFRSAPVAKNNWFNGEAYIDVLDPAAVGKFLSLTMTGYDARFRPQYGRTVPGIFTDEPNCRPFGLEKAFPWTPRLPEAFRRRYGYDLLERLPALVMRPPGFEKVRHDYWRLVTELFADAFSRQYGEACERRGLRLTGHWLCEDNLRDQVLHIGAAMPHYEYEQVPGIDHLCRNIADPLTLKQVASVAHQFGRSQVLCEIFGVSGQDVRFEDCKWIADFHIALGVNYFCPHLTLYSFTGDRKRDYPPTFSYHQPYWPRMGVLNDYLARLGYLVRLGEPDIRILLLHPIASAWAYASCIDACPEVDRFNRGLVALQGALLARHRDFDYGDEIILSRHGRAEGGEFRVATHGRYAVVVVPPSFTWAEKTVSLLEGFAQGGGRILAVGEPPRAVDGEPAPARWESLLRSPHVVRCANQPDAIAAAMDAMLPQDVRITDDAGRPVEPILCHIRKVGDQRVYFFANTDAKAPHESRIVVRAVGTAVKCDPAAGRITPLDAAPVVGQDGRVTGLSWEHRFEPAGSLAVVVRPPAPSAAPVVGRRIARRPAETAVSRRLLRGDWRFARTHPNSLVLDTCRYAVGDAPETGPAPVWKARFRAFEAAGLSEYSGVQPWVLMQKGIRPPNKAPVRIRFEFESDLAAPNAHLVVEKADRYKIRLNGQPVPTDTGQWHWDRQFTRMPVGPLIRRGMNELVLATDYTLGTEIEDVFLVGDFATRKVAEARYAITGEPAALADGDWGPQGYHFYAGNMVYRKAFDLGPARPGRRVTIRLIEPRGTLFDIRVNGRPAATLAWQPWTADVTPWVQDGANELEVVVYGSLRNSFGPLHNTMYETAGPGWWWGPESFTDESHWTDRYLFAPYGLIGGAELAIDGEE